MTPKNIIPLCTSLLLMPALLGAQEPAAAVVDKSFKFVPGLKVSDYADTDYSQPQRPQFHFTSKKNWLNDPNGMMWDGEKFHLYFQHNPAGTKWGNMTWGHATSTDMLSWKQHKHALMPYEIDGTKGTIFSGTAVVDHNNSAGLQKGDQKTLIAFFTFAAEPKDKAPFYQAMAYSNDAGKEWTYWNEGRAVVPYQGYDRGERDPKVFWHEASQQWVMALWVYRHDPKAPDKGPGRVRFFTSKNLKDWAFASDLLRDWAFECMDIFFAPVDGNPAQTKCVIYDASFDYEIGTFDGKEFKTETPALKHARGDFYAAQSFYNAPDNRTVQIGWMRSDFNAADAFKVPFNQQMAFPCELTVHSTAEGPRMKVFPIKEIDSLVTMTTEQADVVLKEGVNALASVPKMDLVDLSVEFSPGTAQQIVFDLPATSVRYDVAKKAFIHRGVNKDGTARDTTCLDKIEARDGKVSVRFLIDRMSIEAYAFGGESFSAHYVNPTHAPAQHSIHAVGGEATLLKLKVRELKSVW